MTAPPPLYSHLPRFAGVAVGARYVGFEPLPDHLPPALILHVSPGVERHSLVNGVAL